MHVYQEELLHFFPVNAQSRLKMFYQYVLLPFIFLASVYSPQSNAQAVHIEVEGEGRDVVLIPGLMSDNRTWQSLRQGLSQRYRLHLVEFSGFSNLEPMLQADELLPQARTELQKYIQNEKLQRPVVIGHSVGGFLAIWLAVTAPGQTGPIISLDGLPYYGPVITYNSDVTVDQMKETANLLEFSFEELTSEAMIEQSIGNLPIQSMREDNQQLILEMMTNSDPRSVGGVMADMLRTDLRGDLSLLESPMLLIGATGPAKDTPLEEVMYRVYEEELLQASEAELIFNSESGHFLQLDQPEWVLEQIIRFLDQHP